MSVAIDSAQKFSISMTLQEQDRQQAIRRMRRYRPPTFKRQQWAAMAIALCVFSALFCFLLYYYREVAEFLLHDACLYPKSLPAETAETLEALDFVEYCVAQADTARSALRVSAYLVLALVWAVGLYLRWSCCHAWRHAFRPLNGQPFTLAISPQGLIYEEVGQSRHFYHWMAVQRIIRDRDFLLFYTDNNVACFIPLDRFGDSDAAESFFQQALSFKQRLA